MRSSQSLATEKVEKDRSKVSCEKPAAGQIFALAALQIVLHSWVSKSGVVCSKGGSIFALSTQYVTRERNHLFLRQRGPHTQTLTIQMYFRLLCDR